MTQQEKLRHEIIVARNQGIPKSIVEDIIEDIYVRRREDAKILHEVLEHLGIHKSTRGYTSINSIILNDKYILTVHDLSYAGSAYRRLLKKDISSFEKKFYYKLLCKTGLKVNCFDEFVQAITKYVNIQEEEST